MAKSTSSELPKNCTATSSARIQEMQLEHAWTLASKVPRTIYSPRNGGMTWQKAAALIFDELEFRSFTAELPSPGG
jgi:hypothetical protein